MKIRLFFRETEGKYIFLLGLIFFLICIFCSFIVLAKNKKSVRKKEDQSILQFNPLRKEAKTGEEIIFRVEIKKANDLFSSPFYISYDQNILDFSWIKEGDFLKKDKGRTIFMHSVKPGEIIIGLTRLGQTKGISGSGVILEVSFKTKKRGKSRLAFEHLDLRTHKFYALKTKIKNALVVVK